MTVVYKCRGCAVVKNPCRIRVDDPKPCLRSVVMAGAAKNLKIKAKTGYQSMTKNKDKYLQQLCTLTSLCVRDLDKIMSEPEGLNRGSKIADTVNSLDLCNDICMRVGLDLSFEKMKKIKEMKVSASSYYKNFKFGR